MSRFAKLWEEVKENRAKLESCAVPHDFHILPMDVPRFSSFAYECTKCGGEVEAGYVFWYRTGLAHGKL